MHATIQRVTDRIIEPRLSGTEIDGEEVETAQMHELSRQERKGLWAGIASMVVGITPSSAATTRTTKSVTWAPRSRMAVKAS